MKKFYDIIASINEEHWNETLIVPKKNDEFAIVSQYQRATR